MNKTILIAGGTAIVSLAMGATGGYLFAKNKITKAFDLRLDHEIAETKKYYALRQMEDSKPASVIDIPITEPEPELENDEPTPDEINKAKADHKERVKKATAGKTALVNYQAFAKPDLDDVPLKEHNIFADKPRDGRPALPPRDEATGKFLPKHADEEEEESPEEDGPYVIAHDDFLAQPYDYAQENLRYFAAEDTLLDYAGEVVENERVGENNLKTFVASNPDAGDIICVRHEAIEHDYEIQFVTESLTEYIGLSES